MLSVPDEKLKLTIRPSKTFDLDGGGIPLDMEPSIRTHAAKTVLGISKIRQSLSRENQLDRY